MTRLALVLLLVACSKGKAKDKDPEPVLCTQIGCASGVELDLGMVATKDVTPTATTKAQVEMCMNKQCTTVALGQLPTATGPIDIDGSDVANVTMSASFTFVSEDAIGVNVDVFGQDTKPFKDGDVYHVTIKSADGRVLADRSWSVAYTITRPNGPKCEPVCAQGTKKTAL